VVPGRQRVRGGGLDQFGWPNRAKVNPIKADRTISWAQSAHRPNATEACLFLVQSTYSSGFRGEERLDERSSPRRAPVAGADDTRDQPATPVDEEGGRRSPHAIDPPRDLATPVDQHRRDVATLPDSTLHEFRVLPEADQEDLETLSPELAIELVDGRQLLPAIGSPGRPEEDKYQLAT